MDIYKSLEDGLYAYVSTIFPTEAAAGKIIFPFQNGPEPLTPYMLIDVKRLDASGREQTSTTVTIDEETDEGFSTTLQTYLATVRFEFIGKYENNTLLAEMAHIMELNLRTPKGYELQHANNLSLFEFKPIERVPLRRETDVYMYYQLDAVFGYSVQHIFEQDWIDSVKIVSAVYNDANQPPDYKMTHTLDIPETP